MAASATRFVLTNIVPAAAGPELFIEAVTDVPATLTLHWTDQPPATVPTFKQRRGVWIYHDITYHFNEKGQVTQDQAADSVFHTFAIPGIPYQTTLWYYFTATIGGLDSPSNTPLFLYQNEEPEVPWTSPLITLPIESLDGFDTTLCTDTGIVTCTSSGADLDMGANPGSLAKLRYRRTLILNAGRPRHRYLRVLIYCYPMAADSERWFLWKSIPAPVQYFGFHIVGNTVYLVSQDRTGQSELDIDVNINPGEYWGLEARLIPNVSLEAYTMPPIRFGHRATKTDHVNIDKANFFDAEVTAPASDSEHTIIALIQFFAEYWNYY